MGEHDEVVALYRELGQYFAKLDKWSAYVLTSHPQFAKLFGRKAERRRKLYNARIACTFHQFNGPRPPGRRAKTIGEPETSPAGEPET